MTPTTVIQKYGGTSVGNAELIRGVAQRIARTAQEHRVAAVVSAMGKTTDDLIALARSISPEPPARELDMLLATGETVACALVAMALRELGADAVALGGGQAGVRTDAMHGRPPSSRSTPRASASTSARDASSSSQGSKASRRSWTSPRSAAARPT